MRHSFGILFLFIATSLSAAYTDTIKVRTHDKVLIQTDPSKGFTRYPKWAEFPTTGKTFHKVYAELTFQCPPGMNCGEWDYINNIYIGKRHGKYNDSLNWEIMRFITPYGLQFTPLWKHTWKFDITDFATLFADSMEIIYRHSGYEAKNGRGWLVTLDFTFIEGPEIMPVQKITQLFQSSVPYGNDSIFNARMSTANFKTGSNTSQIRYKIIQSGHGMDQPDNCAEFCPKLRYIRHDNRIIDTSLVWRTDCGENPVFPQGGTWIYDRTNWCPGAEVREYNVDLPVTPDSEHSMDLEMQSYTRTGSSSDWVITNYLIEYSGHKFRTDAAIETVIRPTDELQYLRLNPACGEPRIIIKNNGSNVFTSALIEYGWKGMKQQRFQWTGNIKTGATDTVDLPYLNGISEPGIPFQAKLIWVNNQQDEYEGNNLIYSFPNKRVDALPTRFLILLRTNNAPTENYWMLKKADGTIIRKRENMSLKNTNHIDTINLESGCYELMLMDDGTPPSSYPLNEDGLGWWANTSDGTGAFQIRNAGTSGIIKSFNLDFGTGIWYQFRVGELSKPETASASLNVYPNPVHNDLLVDLGINRENQTLEIILFDALGREVKSIKRNGSINALQFVDVSQLARGSYTIRIKTGTELLTRKIILN
jgi:hypothetical protein